MKVFESEIITFVKSLLEDKKGSIVVIPHENPDGDAIGSVAGLGQILRNAGHAVTVITPNDYPGFLKWLGTRLDIINGSADQKKAKKLIMESSVIFCLDFNEPRRAGELKKHLIQSGSPKILIDHHPGPSDFFNYIFSDTGYSSTAELVYDFSVAAGMCTNIDRDAAEAIFTGIMTDTGSFSYGISNPNTFRVLSELLAFGINPDKIHRLVYDNYSADRMRLLGYALAEKMVMMPEFRTSYIWLTREELKKYNFVPGDTEGFVNFPLSVSNTVFSALFIEKEDRVKVSLRSKGDFPVNVICSTYFNGGGHKNAAGGDSYSSLGETIGKFRQLLPSYLHQLKNINFDE